MLNQIGWFPVRIARAQFFSTLSGLSREKNNNGSLFTFARNQLIMQKSMLLIATLLALSQMAKAQTDASYTIDSLTTDRSFILTDPQEILKHDDELITVEGCVVRASLKEQVKGKPIFLDMFVAYPDNVLTIAIWEEDQPNFLPAAGYQQKMLRITGRAKKKTYAPPGKAPQERITISLHDPKQINILGSCQ
jgi:hypothetical protein